MIKRNERLHTILQQCQELTYHIENNLYSEVKLFEEYLARDKKLASMSLTLTECHIVAFIGDNESANGTAISKALNISNAGVYKNTVKLAKKKLIKTVKKPDNKKEVHYVLTEMGRQVYELHVKVHITAERQLLDKLDKYTTGELATVSKFLTDFDVYE